VTRNGDVLFTGPAPGAALLIAATQPDTFVEAMPGWGGWC
jgi:hypothetical protein